MKKLYYIFTIAAVAALASCGAKTDSAPSDSAKTNADSGKATTETTTPPATESTPASTPAATENKDGGTSVNVSSEGASVEAGKTKVEVTPNKTSVNIKK